MSFFIPADESKKARALPPDTGYYAVTIAKIEKEAKMDKKQNFRFRCFLRFENSAETSVWFSLPFDEEGNYAPGVQALSELDRDKKIAGMVGALKEICYSVGWTDEYMDENGISSEHLVGSTAHIAWLGRPDDVPEGKKAYGDVDAFITKDQYDDFVAKGMMPADNRQFPWRASETRATTSSSEAGGRKIPAPPSKGGARKIPAPPTRD